MIEKDEDWYAAKKIVPDSTISLEKSVASLSITEKQNIEILTPREVITVASNGIPNQKVEIAVVNTGKSIQRMTRRTQRPISKAEAEEFWRKMQPQGYAITKHLEKVPAQIFVWALLMNSQHHRQALTRALEDTYVPVGTYSDNLTAMISWVTQSHRISFGDEELPFEGVMHNKTLHVTIKCRDMILNRVLIDDGSGLDVCPLSTLKQLSYDVGKIQQSYVNVRAFDGSHRDTLGTVNMIICMGPVEFLVEFQAMDITTSYNMLLGRPWIHMAGVVPSTLHQMVKFVWHEREVVVCGEGSHSNLYASIIDDVTRGTNFYTLEIMNATEEDWNMGPCMPTVYKIIATVMLRNGFELGLGLGKHLQGITEPIPLPAKQSRCGLGYSISEEDEWDNQRDDRVLARPMPHLYESFPVRERIDDNGFGGGIWDSSEEVDAVDDEEVDQTRSVRDASPEDQRTSATLLIPYSPW